MANTAYPEKLRSIYNTLVLHRHFAQSKAESALAGYGDPSNDTMLSIMTALESNLIQITDDLLEILLEVES